jgi:HEAT repeat protein
VIEHDADIAHGLVDALSEHRDVVVSVLTDLDAAPDQLALGASTWADRRVAALALGKLGTGSDIAALTKAAADSSSFVREAVASSLGAIASPAVVDPLLALSRDEVPQVRATAAAALGAVKDDRAQKRRAELAADPDPAVRAAATK